MITRHSRPVLAPLGGAVAAVAACAGLIESGVRAPGSGGPLIALAASLAGFTALTAVFLIAGAVGSAVRSQRRDLAIVRTLAARPAQVHRVVLRQVAGCFLLVVVPGLLLGAGLGAVALGLLREHGVAPPGTGFHSGWIPQLVTVVTVFSLATSSTWLATRPLVRGTPAALLVTVSAGRRWAGPVRVVAGLVLIGGGIALDVVTLAVFRDDPLAASTAGPAPLVWSFGIALLGPGLVAILTAPPRWARRRSAGVLGSATARVAASPVEAATIAVPVAMAVATTLGAVYLNASRGGDDPVNTWAGHLLAALMTGCCALYLLNALVEAAAVRRRGTGTLRTLGASPSWLVRVDIAHAGLLGACGTTTGLAVAAASVVPYQLAVTGRVDPAGSLPALLIAVTAGVLLPPLVAVGSTLLALREPPVRQLASAR